MTLPSLRAIRTGRTGCVFAGLLAALAAGCAPTTPPRGARLWADSYVFSTLGERNFDARDLCGKRTPKRLHVTATSTTVLISLATLGMYTPHEIQVECH